MKNIFVVGILVVSAYIVPLSSCLADETYDIAPITPHPNAERFTNANWSTLLQPEVATFTMLPDGSMHGTTVNGIDFVQYNIPNDAGIRVQRFEIEDHYHYIIDGEVVYSFEDFSAKLAQAYALVHRTSV